MCLLRHFGVSARGGRKTALMQGAPAAGLYNILKIGQLNLGAVQWRYTLLKVYQQLFARNTRPTHTHKYPYRQNGSLIPALLASDDRGRAPSISWHLRHILYMEILPEFGFQKQFQAIFYLRQSPLSYAHFSSLPFYIPLSVQHQPYMEVIMCVWNSLFPSLFIFTAFERGRPFKGLHLWQQ